MPPSGPLGSGPLWGGGWGGWGMGRPYMRRRGFPLFGGYGGWGMGGMGGGGLLSDLLAGGIGYMMGRQSGQQYQQPQYQPPQYQQPQQYQAPYYQPPQTPQYQPPQQYQTPQPQYQPPAAGSSNESLAQLRLLAQLRNSGMLTDDEFEAEKQKILHGH